MIARNDESGIAVIEHGRSSQGRRVILAGGTGAADGRKCACAWAGRGSRRGPRPPYSSPGRCRPASSATRFFPTGVSPTAKCGRNMVAMETFGAAKGAGAGTRSGVFGPKIQTADDQTATHTIWRSEPAPSKMRFLAVGLLASWRSELAPAKTRFGRRPPRRGASRRPLRQKVVRTRPLGRG
jgi:hypothetical protein